MTTTGKVFVGIGIGCFGLMVLMVIGVAAGGFWVKGKVDGVMAEARIMEKQEERARALDAKIAFAKPAQGSPVALTKERLDLFVAIRKEQDEIAAKYEKALEKFAPSDEKKDVTLTDLTTAGSAMLDKMKEQREAFLNACEAKQLSPAEFHAITESIQATQLGVEVLDPAIQERNRVEYALQRAEDDAKDKSLPKQVREHAAKDVKRYGDELAALPPRREPSAEANALNETNRDLIATHFASVIPEGGYVDVFLPGKVDSAVGEPSRSGRFGRELREGAVEPEPAEAGAE